MTLLLKPGPGECVDRLSILRLKVEHLKSKLLPFEQFKEEYEAVTEYLTKNFDSSKDAKTLERASSDLYCVNKQLWQVEDEVRLLAKQMKDHTSTFPLPHRLVEIALEIPRLNDARSELVKQINQLFGINAQEKIYNV